MIMDLSLHLSISVDNKMLFWPVLEFTFEDLVFFIFFHSSFVAHGFVSIL